MFHQSISHSQRIKSSKANKVFQVGVVLAVAVWLLYQVKHSYDMKTEFARTDHSKQSKGEVDKYLGRKGKAGSENVITINYDETTETMEAGGGQSDGFDRHTEAKGEEEALSKEHTQSQEDINRKSKEEGQQEQQHNEDADSHITGGDEIIDKGMSEGTEKVLHLPSQREVDDSSDKNENTNGRGDDSLDGGLVDNLSDSGEVTISDAETISSSTNQTEIVENGRQHEELRERSGKLGDNPVLATEDFATLSLSDDQRDMEMLANDEVHKGEVVESQGDIVSDTEITGNTTIEEASTEARADDQPVGSSLPSEQENAVSSNSKASGSQREGTPEIETTEHQSTKESLPDSTEENNNEEAPKKEEVESLLDNASEAEIGNNSSEIAQTDRGSDDEPAKVSTADEQNNAAMLKTNEASRSEAAESQGENISDTQVAVNNVVEEEKDLKANDEPANSSPANKDENAELPVNSEEAKMEAFEFQGDSSSEAGNSGNNYPEEATSETKFNDEAAKSSHNSEQNNTEIPINETPDGEASESQGDSAFKNGSTANNSLEEPIDEPKSNDIGSSKVG